MTTPTDTARPALDDATATALYATRDALDRVRTALADAYGLTGDNLTEAGRSVAAAEDRARKAERRAEMAGALTAATKRLMERRTTTLTKHANVKAATAEQYAGWLTDAARACAAPEPPTWGNLADTIKELAQDAERFKADHVAACQTIAEMHEAATGRTGMGPIRGVVEDVADVRTRAEQAEAERDRAREQRNTWARQADAEILEHRQRAEKAERLATKNREHADRLAAELAERSKHDGRTAATLQRVRDAETLAQALTAVAEHDGLSPVQAAMSAAFAAAAERPAAVDAERERDHAIRLAAAEQARAEAVRVADRATSTLLRIRHAPTAAAAWSELGTYYHLPTTEAGRSAHKWRTNAERIAERHARRAEADAKEIAEHHERHRRALAAVFAMSAETPFEELTEYAARTLTRSGERLLAAEERVKAAEERAEAEARHSRACRTSRDAWRRRATDAMAAIARVRALLDTHLGPLATKAVRNALDTPTEPAAEPVTCEVSWHVHQETAPTTACRRSAPEEG